MAFKMTNTGDAAMPFIWNVSKRVGGRAGCENLPTDVELVKVLVSLALSTEESFTRIGPRIALNGTFDAVVGYWIFRCEDRTKGNSLVDGIVSPARKGLHYGPGSNWVIAVLNSRAKTLDRAAWEGLATNPRLSAELRRELSTANS